ncbi:hypothetical protein PGH07_00480 [Sulfurovum sp. zt1-1]|uniref:Uncharacterized protein n=1 Tax=Sulfurovum zhangzhouensis TaxID=3019067 RepID=A0ABT7QUX6_9BACT|nr:hypothetical protein [Sulfurovum zhangzhouensis]MDM5270648.1 hypothetical protein [Sulfurovum zhangzhouensis]
MVRIIFILFMLSSVTWAEQNATVEEETWTDTYHRFLTKKLHIFSHHLDEKLSTYDYLIETNATTLYKKDDTTEDETEPAINDWFSSFFKDEIFDEAYTKTYALWRNTLKYDYKAKKFTPSTSFKVSLALPKTKNRLNLYIESDNEETIGMNDYRDGTEGSIGLRYTLPAKNYIHSFVSVGIHGFDNPYLLTHVWVPYNVGKWRNRVSQSFKYSNKYHFEEETNLYFDRFTDDNAMFRIHLGRNTKQEVEGMGYYSTISYNKTTKFNKGYQIGVSTEGQTKPENEITKYSLYGIYKQNIYRKWLYYEVEPRVEWEKLYDFEANYLILVSLEIFFGQ